jgi:hypothetical protein
MKAIAILIGSVGILALIVGLALLFAFPLMWLINYLFTPVVLTVLFGTAKIGFWKTVVLNIISGWLFKGNSTSTSK